MINNKKAAMEMSVGTIVTIVLLMSVLVMGIFLVQKIFGAGTSAIDQVSVQLDSEIAKLFSSEGKSMVLYPSSGNVVVKKGDDPKGFAFNVKNDEGGQVQSYTYQISAQSIPTTCGTLDDIQANSFIIGASGNFELGGGNSLSNARLVRFQVPKQAPSCSFFYQVIVTGNQGQIENAQIFVTFK